MGNITIRIPQQIHIEYTLKNARLTRRILDFLNALFLRDDHIDSDLKEKMTEEPRLGELALEIFGADGGVDLELPRHPPHQPLELQRKRSPYEYPGRPNSRCRLG
ncbi:MAG: hypothetical protein D3916_08435 [Candidatus Electrothrix sp. MAN1_4]|nr:hypothetical protein [Candidatus Electrothrix sp. MAN1_4]